MWRCNRGSPPMRLGGPLHPLTPTNAEFERIEIDLHGHFPASTGGNKWWTVPIHHVIRYLETSAHSSDAVPIVVQFFLGSIILGIGAPRELVSTMGKSVPRTLGQNVSQLHNAIHGTTEAYHLQKNVMDERFN